MTQLLEIVRVSFDVSLQLLLPVRHVAFWTGVASLAAMAVPKTTVDKDGQVEPLQNQIRFSRQSSRMRPKTKSHSVQCTAHSQFRACVFGLYTPHILRSSTRTNMVH
jgi:hypothetical protein